ncbi:MAG: 2Fe-2S iron-sulfur cluster binding domain-containing protein [Trichodesmium sp. St16_bin4-tuft]|nr:2Fe-2S iron-sulfur cluster binding domain-containing protein [Trichodesmium sp. St5_bin8]MDE5077782.1 2Fe-2S iron-sulfur cluster binding domain-containing protein [Trichodesmium sp. St2_bin6]MDE5097941.1 2Fe-2S iron-sulfur cluster binding domain-containing protein [Trichodesmium sp. St16_bin4-tuft]MDE5103048.1 2Fe-2S iron-sulfur cluster binding domain-containing protein [Trichodesmium sp. St19_bin2]
MKILFLPDNIIIDAEVGTPLLEVAEDAGVNIPTGCLMGSCHACEVELNDGQIICACITAIPPGEKEMTINLSVDIDW